MARHLFALLCCLVLATPAWAGHAEGLAAAKSGDDVTALHEFRPLAEQGGAMAQLIKLHLGWRAPPKDAVGCKFSACC